MRGKTAGHTQSCHVQPVARSPTARRRRAATAAAARCACRVRQRDDLSGRRCQRAVMSGLPIGMASSNTREQYRFVLVMAKGLRSDAVIITHRSMHIAHAMSYEANQPDARPTRRLKQTELEFGARGIRPSRITNEIDNSIFLYRRVSRQFCGVRPIAREQPSTIGFSRSICGYAAK